MRKPAVLAMIGAAVLSASALAADFITFGSGSTTGVYFPVATGISKLINDANIDVRANARSTGGSVFNINAIASGELQMALVQNDIAYFAYNGTGIAAFDGKPVKSIRSVAVLYPEVIHVVTRRDSKISSISDLKGKRVIVGDVGSGTEQNTRHVLEAYGMSFSDLGQTIRASASAGATQLQEGKADAMFYTVGLGAAALQNLALTTQISLVPIDLDKIKAMKQKYPFYDQFIIPGNTYKGESVSTVTAAVKSMWVAAESLSADTVYKVLKATIGNESSFKQIHPNLARYFSTKAAVRGLPLPLHPGAERFYKEIGVLK